MSRITLFWLRLPIAAQISILLIAAMGIGGWCFYEIGKSIRIAEARNQARTVADLVDNLGTWASKYGGLWARTTPMSSKPVGDFLEREVVSEQDAAAIEAAIAAVGSTNKPRSIGEMNATAYTSPVVKEVSSFVRKNPALIQRELSDVTKESTSKAKFRMTSDRFHNPNNMPTAFEMQAIEDIRRTGAEEYSAVQDGQMHYARKLVVQPGCMSCHDTVEKAPAIMKAKYPNSRGYGYKVGDVAGVISVAVPLDYGYQSFVRDLGKDAKIAIVGLAALIVLLIAYIQRSIIAKVRKLYLFADRASKAGPDEAIGNFEFVPHEAESHNEVHRLSAAVKRLHASFKIMHRAAVRTDTKNVSPIAKN